MPHGRNMPLDLRDVGPDYTGPLRLNDMVLMPEQEEKLRIKVDQENGRDTMEPSPEFEAIPLLSHSQVTGEAPAAAARTTGITDPPPNLPVIKTEPPSSPDISILADVSAQPFQRGILLPLLYVEISIKISFFPNP